MAESERLLAGEDGTIRVQKILPDQRGQLPGHIPLLGRQDLTGAAVEGLPFNRPALQQDALLGAEPIKPGGEQRLAGRRDGYVASFRLADQREDLLNEQRIASRDRLDPFAHWSVYVVARRQKLVDQRCGLRGLERLQQQGGAIEPAPAPAGPAFEQLRPRQANDQHRAAMAAAREVLD